MFNAGTMVAVPVTDLNNPSINQASATLTAPEIQKDLGGKRKKKSRIVSTRQDFAGSRPSCQNVLSTSVDAKDGKHIDDQFLSLDAVPDAEGGCTFHLGLGLSRKLSHR